MPAAAVVLMYHRVTAVEADVWGLKVDPGLFEEHLKVIRQRYRPLGLLELADSLAKGRVPAGAVVLTFDDGYRDNLEVAKPLLERYEIPATVFAVAGCLDGSRSFWWDELAELCLIGTALPARGEVEMDSRLITWDLTSLNGTGVAETRLEREALCRELREQLLPLPHSVILGLLEELRVLAKLPWAARGSLMTADDIGQLTSGGLIEVGAHTVTHTSLPTLSRTAKLEEIWSAKSRLEALLGRPVSAFSYPFGDVDLQTVECVREIGFQVAVTTAEKAVTLPADPLELPRIYVGNWTGAELGQRIECLMRKAA